MGNTTSSASNVERETKNFSNLYKLIDFIAASYILTSDFESLRNLKDAKYCDDLVILTSDIINKYLNRLDITYLAQRTKKGENGEVQVINELNTEKVDFLTKQQLESLDIKNDQQKSIRKKRVCIGIAKFYIKIAHVFSAIITTINPVYVYMDENKNKREANFQDKNKIPKGTDVKIYKRNICDHRIRILKNYTDVEGDANKVNFHPKICGSNDKKSNLLDEPGIAELNYLYYDKYDYSTGEFIGMSDNAAKQFKKDLEAFYIAYTGNTVMPPEIQKFSDIKLKDYNKQAGCQGKPGETPTFKKSYILSKNDKLFIAYANNLKQMIQSAETKHNELLPIINDLFSFVTDPYTDNKKIRVNPKLTEEGLNKIVEKTRKIIIELYTNCEKYFDEGVKIYEAIVAAKLLETTKNQINALSEDITTNSQPKMNGSSV
jgi:hypothetical protein